MTHIKNLKLTTFTVVLAIVLYFQSNYNYLVLFVLLLTLLLEVKCIVYFVSRKKAAKLVTTENDIYLANHPSKLKSLLGYTIAFKRIDKTLITVDLDPDIIINLNDSQFHILNTGCLISIRLNNINFNIIKLIEK
ncbi:hypothetical protein [Fusibacter bizertensis]